MADEQLANFYKTQISFTEWLQAIDHQDLESLRREDYEKRERLKVLKDHIGLPFDQPVQFSGAETDLTNPEFAGYLQNHGDELCAIRVIPLTEGLPKLRIRGKSVRDAYDWFTQQEIDRSQYRVDFVPHEPDAFWATIFVINQHGIQGEIIWGGHHQLTQGVHETGTPHVFRYDFETWNVQPENPQASAHLKQLVEYLHVPDPEQQARLADELGATFSHNYLEGYFESAESSLGIWFKDYSPIVGRLYADFMVQTPQPAVDTALVTGQAGSTGKARGRVRVVDSLSGAPQLEPDEILVCRMTTPDHLPLMQQAAAIVTDMGGMLSHAAIVARELGKPCLTATGNATAVLINGQLVEVDADAGVVRAA
jgi:phosphohistidine swiveling domain-containing protein